MQFIHVRILLYDENPAVSQMKCSSPHKVGVRKEFSQNKEKLMLLL